MRKITLLAALLFLLPSLSGVAQSLNAPSLPTVIAPPPAALGGTLDLDLMAAYQLALARNLNLQVGRYDLALADAEIRRSGGIFDPTFRAWANGSSTQSPTSTILEGANVAESARNTYGLSLDQLLPSGTLLGIEASSVRSSTNSTFFFLNPSYNANLRATLTQPLLNGFGTVANRAGIVIAENVRDQTAIGFEVRVIETLRDVEQAYWELQATRETVNVSEQSLRLAKRLLAETKARVEVGTSAPIDLVQSEAGVATRLQALIYARNAAANAEDNLKSLLGFDLPIEWQTRIETADSYEIDTIVLDLDKSITTAIEKRPAIIQKELDLERLDVNVKVARNRAMPNLDLTASLGYGGLSGNSTITDPETGEPIDIRQNLGDAARQVWNLDFPSWILGVQYSVPLGNHQAKETLVRRRFERDRGEVELAALKQQIIREVRFAVRAVEDGAAAIEASVASSRLAQRNLEAEQTKFKNGLSTNFQVLQIQDDLANAQLLEIRARVDYRKALAAFYSATGTYLESKDVTIADPGAPDSPHDFWKDVEWLQFTDFKQAKQQITVPEEPVDTATD